MYTTRRKSYRTSYLLLIYDRLNNNNECSDLLSKKYIFYLFMKTKVVPIHFFPESILFM